MRAHTGNDSEPRVATAVRLNRTEREAAEILAAALRRRDGINVSLSGAIRAALRLAAANLHLLESGVG
jgi:hypothetical protein